MQQTDPITMVTRQRTNVRFHCVLLWFWNQRGGIKEKALCFSSNRAIIKRLLSRITEETKVLHIIIPLHGQNSYAVTSPSFREKATMILMVSPIFSWYDKWHQICNSAWKHCQWMQAFTTNSCPVS